jgi:uncharacterized membrane protein
MRAPEKSTDPNSPQFSPPLTYINALFVIPCIGCATLPAKEGVMFTRDHRLMPARKAPYVMLGLALLGMADAFYVANASYTGQPLREFLIEGANTVLNSPYGRILDVPLSYFGFIYYVHMFGLASLLAFDPSSRGLRLGAVLYAALGVAASIYFVYLQVTYIHAVCIYCLLSAVTTLLLFATASWHVGATRMEPAISVKVRAVAVG